MPITRTARTGVRHINTRQEPFRILVGSSGDESSLGAIHLAQAIARRKGATVHALAVATPFPHGMPSVFSIAPPPIVDEHSRLAAIEALRSQLTTIRGTAGWTMRATVGFAADSIVDTARRWPASLVVIGLGEHGLLDRLIRSETAVQVVKHATSAVLAVPATARELPRHAVVAVDFTESSVEAAMLAASLLGRNGRLTLLHATPLAGIASSGGDPYLAAARPRLARIADSVRRRTKHEAEGVLVPGAIVGELISFATDQGCDLIGLGAHQLSLLERVLAGSVRTQVLRSANCSVLITPGGTEG